LQSATGGNPADRRYGARALKPSDVLDFWCRDTPQQNWFVSDAALDDAIREIEQSGYGEVLAELEKLKADPNWLGGILHKKK